MTRAAGPGELAAPKGRRRRSQGNPWLRRLVLLGPGITWWTLFFAVPVAILFAYSFFRRGTFGGVVYELTLDNYRRAIDPIYLNVLWFSIRVAVITTGLALLIGYPAAYFIASGPRRLRLPLLVLVILPFWTSFLIRTYAWIVLLNPVGLINRSLQGLGVTDGPLPLLYNEFAIVLGLVYAYLPLMILPLYASIERLGPSVREVASDLGAPPANTFVRVTLPLTLPGIAAGCIFVFVPSLGNFIVPELLGGGRRIMMGNLIQQQFLQARDWPFGATLALFVVALMLVLLAIQARILNRERAQVDDGR